ncbi:MAG: phosphate uptake regulator PhoU [Nitrososphaerales archaeon]
MEVRKVQKVGYSTLTISLPRDWIKEKGLKAGDIITFVKGEDGSLKLYAGILSSKRKQVKCFIDADQCKEKGLISRIITGSYIIAHDIVEIASKRELQQEHLNEIRQTVQKLNGLGIVEQSLKHIVLQSFIDPENFPFQGLLKKLYIITSSMLSAILKALQEMRRDLLVEVLNMEDEVDRIYWLGIRQLVLAAKDRELGKIIGIEDPAHVVGNRVILMSLEKIGDLLADMAEEALSVIKLDVKPPPPLLKEISELANKIANIYDRVVSAFLIFDLKLANKLLEEIEEVRKSVKESLKKLIQISEFAQQNDYRLLIPLRTVMWNLGEVVRLCGTLAQITMNRSLEFQNDICRLEELEQ